eukprot:Amastigsp_a508580_58.p3 type:complete len:113 gc:universal Amastigsp_a508580_58:69-407(+)
MPSSLLRFSSSTTRTRSSCRCSRATSSASFLRARGSRRLLVHAEPRCLWRSTSLAATRRPTFSGSASATPALSTSTAWSWLPSIAKRALLGRCTRTSSCGRAKRGIRLCAAR